MWNESCGMIERKRFWLCYQTILFYFLYFFYRNGIGNKEIEKKILIVVKVVQQNFFFIHFLFLNMCECVFFSIVFFWSRKRKKRNQLNQIFVTEWNGINVYLFIFISKMFQRDREREMYRRPQVIFYEINSISIACFSVYDVQNVGLSFLKNQHNQLAHTQK